MAILLMALACSQPASTAQPGWEQERVFANPSGVNAIAAGLDGAGRTTVAWERPDGVYVGDRAPGAREYTSRRLADGENPAIGVADSGAAAIAWRWYGLWVATRRPGGDFGPPQRVDDAGVPARVVVGDQGHVAVMWEAETTQLRLATGQVGGRIGPARTVTVEAPPGIAGTSSLAMNSRGDLVVAWERFRTTPPGAEFDAVAVYQAAGGRLGPEELILDRPPATAHNVGVEAGIDDAGRASVALSQDHDTTAVATRNSQGGWTLQSLGPGTYPGLAVNGRGDRLVWWRDVAAGRLNDPPTTWWVAKGGAGGPIGPRQALPGSDDVYRPHGGLDAQGNATLLRVLPNEGFIRAVSLTPFGPIQDPRPLSRSMSLISRLAVNGRGAAIASYRGMPSYAAVIERRADASPPSVGLRRVVERRTRVSGTVRCDEPCWVKAAAVVRGARKPRFRGRARLLRARRSQKVTVRLGRPKGRRRARRAVLLVRGVDSAGNVRIVRRAARRR